MSAENDFDILLANARTDRVAVAVEEGDSFIAHIADLFNNRPAGDTEITVSADGDCSLITQDKFTVTDSNSSGAFTIPIGVEGEGGNGTVTVTVDGVTTETFPCNTLPPPDPNGLVNSPN